MARRIRVAIFVLTLVGATGVISLWGITERALRPVPANLAGVIGGQRPQLTDRQGTPLNYTYTNRWNVHELVPLREVPDFLADAFINAEDRRFYVHSGQDWLARMHALWQNVVSLRGVRGASTITEQVVRMLHPRPRTLWSRWLEGWEARRLERSNGKLQILEFYLNQVPYAANRRGVVQAARYYFDRDLTTLSRPEMLTLAVLVRAPSRMDPFRGNRDLLERAVARLRARMIGDEVQPGTLQTPAATDDLQLHRATMLVEAPHFVRYLTRRQPGAAAPRGESRHIRTTLDGPLQTRLQDLLDQRLRALAGRKVTNAALLVADHRAGEVLAWVVGGAGDDDVAGHHFDAVTTPRQPGSTLKPFLYALALERGWTAATIIDDAPLTEMVARGLHSYRNYSRTFYGPVMLRSALGNSLNIPAVRTVQFTGANDFLSMLAELGFHTLLRDADYYGDGLALGNGEVTLLELVQAYGALANGGLYRDLAVRLDDAGTTPARRIFSPEVASLLGNILSDPDARRLEFGDGSLLNLPVQTAVKTGTSSDHRDSWAVGYDHRYLVGVWMGNLDQTPTVGITGSTGPAMALRATFDLLNRYGDTQPLWLSPRLQRRVICADTGMLVGPGSECPHRSEYFVPGSAPTVATRPGVQAEISAEIRLRQPTPGLHMAYDPRLPPEHQGFQFLLQGVANDDEVTWHIDDGEPIRRSGPEYLWPLARGRHHVSATVLRNGLKIASIEPTQFVVK